MPYPSEYRKNDPSPIDRIPPQSLEAEQAVLGSLMLDKEAVIKIADIVEPSDFYRDAHATIFRAMLTLYEQRVPIDLLSLTNSLSEKDQLDIVGGRSFLASLASSVPTASNIVYHANIVRKKAILRQLIRASHQITSLAYNEDQDIEDILDEAERHVFTVSQKSVSQNFIDVKSVLHEAFERIDNIHKSDGALRGVPTGFADIDNLLAGLQPSDLIILAARPSVGKTSLALDIARNVCMNAKIPVGLFSLEMSKEQLVDRILCSQASVDSWKLRTGRLSNDDFERINYAMGVLAEVPLYIDDTAGMNVMQMRTMARRLQSEHGLGMLVVDYLQLMEGRTTRDNRVEAVSEISRFLKSLARELHVPILALSQLSRAVEQREGGIPKLSDLRESGSIEQDADVVMFIHRPDMHNTNPNEERTNLAKIIIAKHRNGPTGEVELYFQAEQASFRSLTEKFESDPFAGAPVASAPMANAATSASSMSSSPPESQGSPPKPFESSAPELTAMPKPSPGNGPSEKSSGPDFAPTSPLTPHSPPPTSPSSTSPSSTSLSSTPSSANSPTNSSTLGSP